MTNNSKISGDLSIKYSNQKTKVSKFIKSFSEVHFSNKEIDILLPAFFHGSSKQNKQLNPKNLTYEKLEFFGDAIFNYLTSWYIVTKLELLEPGVMTDIRKKFINTEAMASICVTIGLDKLLVVGESVDLSDNRHKIFADLLEAFIGGFYLVKGEVLTFKMVKEKFIIPFFSSEFLNKFTDFKSLCLEFIAKDNYFCRFKFHEDYYEDRKNLYHSKIQLISPNTKHPKKVFTNTSSSKAEGHREIWSNVLQYLHSMKAKYKH